MARPNRAASAQRKRRAKDRAVGDIERRILAVFRRTLCTNHFFQLNDGEFKEQIGEACSIFHEYPDWAEENVYWFFPADPAVITQEMVAGFTEWLKSDLGEPIRHEGLHWCGFLSKVFLKCSSCSGVAPIVIPDSDDEITVDGAPLGFEQKNVDKGESSAPIAKDNGSSAAMKRVFESVGIKGTGPVTTGEEAMKVLDIMFSIADGTLDPMRYDPDVTE